MATTAFARKHPPTVRRTLSEKSYSPASIDTSFERRALNGLHWREAITLAEKLALPVKLFATYIGLPSSTFFARKDGKFAAVESDRILRYERLLAVATKTFGDEPSAVEWLKVPNPYLGGEVPLDKARTDGGARQVETLLQRIDFGLS